MRGREGNRWFVNNNKTYSGVYTQIEIKKGKIVLKDLK